MKIKFMFMNTSKLCQSYFTETPKVFNPVYMIFFISEFILSMLNSVMSFISKICKSIISFKTICIYYRFFICLFTNYWQNLFYRTILHNLCINFSIPFKHSKNRNFSFRTSTSNTTNSSGSEITLIKFYFAFTQWIFRFTTLSNTLSNFVKNFINCYSTNISYFSNFFCFYVKAKVVQNIPKFLLGNSGPNYILVFHRL